MQYHQKCVGVPCSYNFDSFLNTSGKQYVPLLHCVQEFFLLEQSEQLIHRQMVLESQMKVGVHQKLHLLAHALFAG